MKTFTIFKYTVIRYWRDKGSVFQSTLQPFVFVLILGLALGSQFDQQAEKESSSSEETVVILQELELNDVRSSASSMEYYSVTMLVMTMLFGTMFASYGLSEDLLRSVGQRMSAAPLFGFEQYLGKVAGSAFFVWLLGIVLIVATAVFFRVPWFHNFGSLLAVCAAISIFATSLGALSIIVFRSEELSGMILNLIILAWTLFAGGFIILPRNRITYILELATPNRIGHNALFNLLYWEQPGVTAQSIGILLAMSVMAGCAAILIERRRMA